MRKKLLVVVFFIAALPVFAQPGECISPANAELDKFPIVTKITTKEQVEFNLTIRKLDAPMVVNNYHRNIRKGCFVLEKLAPGTLVFVDKAGTPRYKVDCSNRITEVLPCPICPAEASVSGIGKSLSKGSSKKILELTDTDPGGWTRFWDSFGQAWDSSWGGLGSFLGTLLPSLILPALIGAIAYLLWRAQQNRQVKRCDVPSPTPVQAATVGAGGDQPGPSPQPPQGAAPAGPLNPAQRIRMFRFSVDQEGNLFSRMEGYKNLRVQQDANGNITINADRA